MIDSSYIILLVLEGMHFFILGLPFTDNAKAAFVIMVLKSSFGFWSFSCFCSHV